MQTRIATPPGASAHGEPAITVNLFSPRSQPLESPGWIIPFEMEESAEYAVAENTRSLMETAQRILEQEENVKELYGRNQAFERVPDRWHQIPTHLQLHECE